jgi:hypothetical protein
VGKNPQLKEVEQVKVLSFIDEHHFEAEIVKSKIKVGDMAQKESAGLLVQPAQCSHSFPSKFTGPGQRRPGLMP